MKILKESNEKLPIQFVTDFVSEGWNEVGKIKGEIEIVKGFSGSKDVAEVLQKLADAYLVCIGQLEAFLTDKKYIKEADELKEAVDIHIEGNEVTIADASGEEVGVIPVDPEKEDSDDVTEQLTEQKYVYSCDPSQLEGTVEADNEEEAIEKAMEKCAEKGIYVPDEIIDVQAETDETGFPEVSKEEEAPVIHDKFEYFVDFDEPAGEPVTDAEIEQLQKAGR